MPKSRETYPLKIAMLGSFPPLRALSSYCLEHATAIADSVRVQFISFKKIYPKALYPGRDLVEDHTYPIINNSSLEVRRRLAWYNPLTWIIEGLFTDGELLHAQYWSPPLIPIYLMVCLGFKLRGKPVVFTVHNILHHEKHHIHEMLSRLLFKLGDYYIVHTETNRRQLNRYFGIKNDLISVIPHGPLDFFVKNVRKDRERIRYELGFESNEKVILFFGAIRPYKGIDTILKAFPNVLDKIPDIRLFIAGKLWEDWGPYERLIKDLGIKRYVKTSLQYIPSNQVCDYFLTADLVVLPYHHFDSQSGVGATAISFHKPMIVSDVGGLPELVYDERYIVPPNDPQKLANAIVECIDHPETLNEMSRNAEIVADGMKWSSITQKTISVYRKLIAQTLNRGG